MAWYSPPRGFPDCSWSQSKADNRGNTCGSVGLTPLPENPVPPEQAGRRGPGRGAPACLRVTPSSCTQRTRALFVQDLDCGGGGEKRGDLSRSKPVLSTLSHVSLQYQLWHLGYFRSCPCYFGITVTGSCVCVSVPRLTDSGVTVSGAWRGFSGPGPLPCPFYFSLSRVVGQ